MNNKGMTIIELLIAIVVMGIIATFSITGISEVLTNVKKNALVTQGDSFVNAAKLSYNKGSDIWDDNKATLAELLADGAIETIGKDPWGTEYIADETYVIIEESSTSTANMVEMFKLSVSTFDTIYVYSVRVVTETATIGYEGALQDFSKADVVFFNIQDASVFERVFQSFDSNLDENIDTNEGDDDIQVQADVRKGSSITTNGGDDTVTIGDDVKESSSVDLGAGDDTLNMDGEVTGSSTIDTGAGNDTVNIGDDIQDNSVVNTGDGNDTVTVDDDLQSGAVLNTGNGDDVITVNDELDDGTINSGDGNDTIVIEDMKDTSVINSEEGNDDLQIGYLTGDSTINTGIGNDTVYINSVSSAYDGSSTLGDGNDTLEIVDASGSSKHLKYTDGTFDGGAGYDVLILDEIDEEEWNDYVSDLFSNFEEIRLSDKTIYS